jgi:hypothetical protein
MKKLVYVLFALFITACGGSNSGSGGGKVATTPLDTRCLDGSAYCNSSVYNQYNQYGFSSYPGYYGYGNNLSYYSRVGFCNCPAGSIPVYNQWSGLGCVQNTFIRPFAGFQLYWNFGVGAGYGSGYGYGNYGYGSGWGYNQGYQNNWQQISNTTGYGYNNYNSGYGGSCSNGNIGNLTQSCLVDRANSCGNGGTCRPTGGGSRLGICVGY